VVSHNGYVISLANITLSIPDETKARMKQHPHMRWSSAIRSIIERQLDDFEQAEALARKGGLTQEDVDPILKKIEAANRKHVRALLP